MQDAFSALRTSPQPGADATPLPGEVPEAGLVLVVGDATVYTAQLLQQLRMEGYSALRAEDGVTAMEQFATGRCAMVIVDVNMGSLDGYAFARAVRAREFAQDSDVRVPLIAWSANPLSEEAEICIASGVDDYLAKPLEARNLTRKLDKWLRIASELPPVDAGGFTLTGPAPL